MFLKCKYVIQLKHLGFVKTKQHVFSDFLLHNFYIAFIKLIHYVAVVLTNFNRKVLSTLRKQTVPSDYSQYGFIH